MRKVVLASGSPRRKRLLENIGLTFVVEESGFPEETVQEKSPEKLAKYLSLKKAETIAKNHTDAVIIGADSVVWFENEIYGKPENKKHAKEMLKKFAGKIQYVITGFTIIDTKSGKTVTKSVKSSIKLRKMIEEEIDWYVSTGEPMGKAGSYAAQEKGSIFVEKVNGDFLNVVGLPIVAVVKALREFGVNLSDLK